MKTIAQSGEGTPSDRATQLVQVELPTPLARRAKAVAAENGLRLRQLLQAALEQYLGKGKAP